MLADFGLACKASDSEDCFVAAPGFRGMLFKGIVYVCIFSKVL